MNKPSPLIFKYGCLVLGFACLLISATLKAQKIELLQQGKPTSIRGLSVVDDKIAWLSGSKGYVAISKDAGKTWDWQQVKGYEQADFRDIEAFSDKEAIIMSSGTPALILKTIDGGATWDLKYKNEDKAYFLDAMDFANKKHGFILGDPINSKFLLLETTDGGNTWQPFKNMPDAMPGEAAFAASGTCLRVDKKGGVIIVTGGKVARWLTYFIDIKQKKKLEWYSEYLPIKQGEASQGAFSYADFGVIVGGDYLKDKDATDVGVYYDPMIVSIKNGIERSKNNPAGYQSCVECVNDKSIFLSTGTSGSNITTDGGRNWAKIDEISYNVCRKAKKGSLVLLAGDRGKIAIYKP